MTAVRFGSWQSATTTRVMACASRNTHVQCRPVLSAHTALGLQRTHHSYSPSSAIYLPAHPLLTLSSTGQHARHRHRRHLEAPKALHLGEGDPDIPPSRDGNGVSVSNDSDSDASSSGTVEIDLELPRRSMLVKFTCNVCSGRTERLVNPLAWEKGMVIAQCSHCQVWHKLADAANMVEEIRYSDIANSDDE